MKVIVLIKQVPDTWEDRHLDTSTGLLDRDGNERVIDEIDERALEVALQLKDADRSVQVVAATMGPAAAETALRRALAMGADSAIHILDDRLAGTDAARTAAVLAAAVRSEEVDLVIAGNESTDGRGGVIAAAVAEHLGLPLLSFLDSLEVSGTAVTGVRRSDGGSVEVHAPLPAVVSVTEQNPEARFPNLRGTMSAKRKPLARVALDGLGVDSDGARSVVVSVAERPARAAGRKVVDDGTAAAQLADYLAEAHLI